MEKKYYQKVYYKAEQFNGEQALADKYHMKHRKAKDGTIHFLLGNRRVHLGDWLVRKEYTDKVKPVDNYCFELLFKRNEDY